MRLLVLSIIMSFIAFSMSVSSCIESSRAESPQPAETLRFDDVPVPIGFKLIPGASFIADSAGKRAGELRFTGMANIENVVNFYKNQMSIYNWVLLNMFEDGERVLTYERGNESCVIVIKPRGGSRVDISVALAPKSPTSASSQQAVSEEPVEVEQIK